MRVRLPVSMRRRQVTDSVIAAAQQLGLTIGKRGSAHWLSPCPSCGAEKRHPRLSRDHRGAIGVRPDDEGWRCFVCDRSGNARTLAWLVRDAAPVVHRAPEPVASLPYVDAHEARRFWTRLNAARSSAEVSSWLDANRIGQAPCARSIGTYAPSWAKHWRADGLRLVLALHDHEGRCRGFAARNVLPDAYGPKSSGAGGFTRTGLVMADGLGVKLLRGQYTGPCLIVEGEKKLLISEHLSRGRWATIATGSGLWSAALAESIGRASRVLVYTDPDEPGARYARAILKTLLLCELRREFVRKGDTLELLAGHHVPDDDAHVAGNEPAYVGELSQ